jgi:urease accessory protein
LDAGAAALTRELVILGRHDEEPGRYRAELRCELEGRPLLHEAVEIDGKHGSPALLGDARAFASLALLGVRSDWGQLELAGPGAVSRCLAPDAATLTSLVAPLEERAIAALRGFHDAS